MRAVTNGLGVRLSAVVDAERRALCRVAGVLRKDSNPRTEESSRKRALRLHRQLPRLNVQTIMVAWVPQPWRADSKPQLWFWRLHLVEPARERNQWPVAMSANTLRDRINLQES